MVLSRLIFSFPNCGSRLCSHRGFYWLVHYGTECCGLLLSWLLSSEEVLNSIQLVKLQLIQANENAVDLHPF